MNKGLQIFLVVFVVLLVVSCDQKKPRGYAQPVEGYASGNIKILADASFEPIVAEERNVFEHLYNQAKVDVRYLTENELLNSFLNDSIRIAILSRELKAEEVKILTDRKLPPIVNRFAIDAVAIIVNNASTDTLITVDEIKKMLNGNTKSDKNIVFDNPNSSLVRYLKDFAGNVDLKQKNIYALKSNKEVIKYVSEHVGAIGIVGFSWLNDPDDDYATYVDKVKIVAVKDDGNKTYPNEYFKPSQNTLVLHQY
ncbi:MAG: phosphate ABC transporter substrate-binding protein, partial [Flavobacterium sp.]